MEVLLPARNKLLKVHAHSNWSVSFGPSVGGACTLYPPREGKEGKEFALEVPGDSRGGQESRSVRILDEE